MPAQEHTQDEVEEVESDDEYDAGCCVQCCETCGWVKAACYELCRLFCWPPVPSRIASKLAFVPPPPHYGTLYPQAQNACCGGSSIFALS